MYTIIFNVILIGIYGKGRTYSSPSKSCGCAQKSKAEIQSLKKLQSEPIAVIGMGCRFPGGANSPEQFWHLLEKGYDSVVEIPKERWNIDDFMIPILKLLAKCMFALRHS